MATNKIYKFATITAAQYFLNGAILGGSMPRGSQGASGWYGLVGTTLIFTTPAVTVTFTDGIGPDPYLLQLSDVKAQIEAAAAGLLITTVEMQLAILEKVPSAGVVLSHTGTANRLLGFDVQSSTVGKVFAPPGAASPITTPSWTWAYSVNENMHVIFTLE